MEKKIIIKTEFGANYVWHILAVSKTGYNSEYADIYKDSIFPEDLEFLEKNKKLIKFGEGESGVLTGIIVFLPAFLNLKNEKEFKEYYFFVKKSLKEKNWEYFIKRYERRLKDFMNFLKNSFDESFPLKVIGKYLGKIEKFEEIFLRNLGNYKRLWKGIKPELEEKAKNLNRYFKDKNLIHKWEKITGLKFESNKFEVILCYSNKNGPDANSLSYSKVIFYYAKPKKWMKDFISHEVGTHILIRVLREFSPKSREEWKRLFFAYEVLSMFYNKKVLRKKLIYSLSNFEEKKFLSLYNRIYHKNSSPFDLLKSAFSKISFLSEVSIFLFLD